MHTFEQSKLGYAAMWRQMTVKPEKVHEADAVVARIVAHKDEYLKVEAGTSVPWFFVACLHYRESDLDFKTHLHNGDPLTHRTVHVPKGRPLTGEPPFAWYDSAIDALTLDGVNKVTDWSAERMAYTAEAYNGWGYSNRDINSPYVWSWSNLQQSGKFVSDGKFDANAVDTQCGVMVLISRLMVADQSIAAFLNKPTAVPIVPPQPQPAPAPAPPPASVKKETPTVTTPAAIVSAIPFASIEADIAAILPIMSTVSAFVPALAPVVTIANEVLPLLKAVETVLATYEADIAAGKTEMVALSDTFGSLSKAMAAL